MSGKLSSREVLLKGGASLLLREAEECDAEQMLAYLNRVGGESDNLLFGKDEFQMDVERERELILSLKQRGKSIMLLGFVGEELVTLSSLSSFDGRARIAHRAELAVSVRKDHWGLGIGRAAMEALIGFAGRQGIEILQLEVRADNVRAVALYESLGFEKIGRYRRFFKIDGCYFDAVPMNLYL